MGTLRSPEVLAQYHLSYEDKFENGQFLDRGRTVRRHVAATAFILIGKEANQIGQCGKAHLIIVRLKKKFGWHCLNIFEEDGKPPWTFSIGFHKTWNFPELIVIGLKREVPHSTLNIVATQLAEGTRLDHALASGELFNDFACCFVEVPKPMYRKYVGTASWFYGGDAFPLYQIVWPSRDGYFPWE